MFQHEQYITDFQDTLEELLDGKIYTHQQIIKLSNTIFISKKEIDTLKWLNLVEDAIQFSQKNIVDNK